MHKVDRARGEPDFVRVDNPGNWSPYTFRAKFTKRGSDGRYLHHEMPAGARVVPINPSTGKRTVGDWEFFYKGWSHHSTDDSFWRKGTSRDNIFPPAQRAQLDGPLLTKMGLTKHRMQRKDALFFYQLLLPLCDPKHSGIEDDPRVDYYESVSMHTNVYAAGVLKLGTRGHHFKQTNAEELVNWDGIVARNNNKDLGASWIMEKSNYYDEVIADTMSYRRWLEIKRCMKLCPYFSEKDRTTSDYDPTQKYRLIWDVFVKNLNKFVKRGGTDVTIDETTWPNSSYADVHSRLMS